MATYAGHWGPEPFLDRAGRPRPDADVYVYTVGTTTPITLYANRLKSATLANPIPQGVADGIAGLDDSGNGDFYAEPGEYRMVVKINGGTVFDDTVTVAVDASEPGFGGGSSPTGPAGGALSGTYPNPALTAGIIADAAVAAGAAIAEGKLALASDAAAATPSRRTLGTGALQAAAGNDARLAVGLTSGTMSFPIHVMTNPQGVSPTSWTFGVQPALTGNVQVYEASAGDSAYLEWAVLLCGGTYTLGATFLKYSAAGKVQASIDGVDVGSLTDLYAASPVVLPATLATGITIGTAGTWRRTLVRFTANGKNAASAGFGVLFGGLGNYLQRTA